MERIPVHLLEIFATFHPGNIGTSNPLFTFSGDIEGTTIRVPRGLAMIVFHLETDPPTIPALFQTSPVQWFGTDLNGNSTGRPVETPGMFVVQRADENSVTLLDYNVNRRDSAPDMIHWFNLVVAYDGKTYGADPTIVNEPPVG
jgi:hypothetical protein